MGRRARIVADCSRCDHSIQLPVRPDSILRCPKCESVMRAYSSTLPIEKIVENRTVIQEEETEMSTQLAEPAAERFVPDKEEFLKQIAAGKSISKLERLWNMNPGSLHYWVGKWSLKGIKPERAQQLLDEIMIDRESLAPKTGLIALNEQHNEEEAKTAGVTEPTNKDAEIADLNARLKRAVERIETMTETTNDALDRNTALKQERDDYKQAATDLEVKLVSYMDTVDAGKLVISELENDRSVLLATIEQASKDEEITPAPKLAGRSLHTELDAPTEQIVDELAALISYIRSGNGERFYLDLQLVEVAE